MIAEPAARMSYEAYLALEREAVTKHEYLRGMVLAMAGGSPEHARLASSLARLVGNAVVGRPCAIVETDRSAYPDLTVHKKPSGSRSTGVRASAGS